MEKVFFISECSKYSEGEHIPLEVLDIEKECPELVGKPILNIHFSDYVGWYNPNDFPVFVHELLVPEAEVYEDKENEDVGYLAKPPRVAKLRLITEPPRRIDRNDPRQIDSMKRARRLSKANLAHPFQGGCPGQGKRA
ncbi:MAG: hypothetical protein ABH830_00320 [Patescibacteria group bacterium]